MRPVTGRPESDPLHQPAGATEAQVYPSRDSETQTGVQAGTAAPISRSFAQVCAGPQISKCASSTSPSP